MCATIQKKTSSSEGRCAKRVKLLGGSPELPETGDLSLSPSGQNASRRHVPLEPMPLQRRFLDDPDAMKLLTSDLVLAQYPYMSEVAFLVRQSHWPMSSDLWKLTRGGRQVSVICDNTVEDQPIIYVNDNFEGMTLFRKEEILGRNCRFLQGKCTNPETVKQIGDSIRRGEEMEVEILNYRRNGVPFWNKYKLSKAQVSFLPRVLTVSHCPDSFFYPSGMRTRLRYSTGAQSSKISPSLKRQVQTRRNGHRTR